MHRTSISKPEVTLEVGDALNDTNIVSLGIIIVCNLREVLLGINAFTRVINMK